MNMLPTVKDWVESWQRNTMPGEVVWREHHWKIIGKHQLPCQINLANAKEVAIWANELSRWNEILSCYQQIRDILPNPSSQLLKRISSTDLTLLLDVVKWFENNRSSGLYLRQLPINGVHTKWIENNRDVILKFISEIRGVIPENDFHQALGLRLPPHLIRLRILDPDLRHHVGGFSDITLRFDELSQLKIMPSQVIIVENLQSGLALDDLPGTVAFLGLGNAVSVLSKIPWLVNSKCYYWGDIDTYGFAILNNLRSLLPNVQSLLMDIDTLMHHEGLWVREDKQFNAEKLPCLTAGEQSLYTDLKLNHRGDKVRLEQERIPWDYAWPTISSLITENACALVAEDE